MCSIGQKSLDILTDSIKFRQGSFLAPVLFNVYTTDLGEAKSRKCINAYDLDISYQYRYKVKIVVSLIQMIITQ